MKMKQYMVPVVDVALVRTKELMKIETNSQDNQLPPGAGSAPRRKTEVF